MSYNHVYKFLNEFWGSRRADFLSTHDAWGALCIIRGITITKDLYESLHYQYSCNNPFIIK